MGLGRPNLAGDGTLEGYEGVPHGVNGSFQAEPDRDVLDVIT